MNVVTIKGFTHSSQDFPTVKICQKNCIKPKPTVMNCSLKNETDCDWFSPTSLSDLLTIVKNLRERQRTFRLVAGNTSTGIFKDQGQYHSYIGINNVKELTEKKVL